MCERAPARDQLTLTERARLLCHAVFEIAIEAGFATPDADTLPFIAMNQAAAQRLLERNHDTLVIERYREMLASQIRGDLWNRDPSLRFLEKIWDKGEAARRRRNGQLKAVDASTRSSQGDDDLITSLRSAVERGSERT